MNDNLVSAADIMMKIVNSDSFENDGLESTWKTVVSKIHSNSFESENSEKRLPLGERLASNTRVIDLKNGVLLIETDHSGWIQYLKFYQKFIITGLKRSLPNLEITNFAFRTAGSKALLGEAFQKQVDNAKREMDERISKTEKELDGIFGEKNENINDGSNLPPEILEKFESMKKSMLTNFEK